MKNFLILVLFSITSVCASSDLVYKSFNELIDGLSDHEIKMLKQTFNQNKIIDLEKSNRNEIKGWLDEVVKRLSSSVEEYGVQYPMFHIYIIDSTERHGYIFKHLPPGLNFFKGHVFLSTSFIDEFATNLGLDVLNLSEGEDELILKCIQGVLAHEFMHPKQDELVKSEWTFEREGFDSHTQADELTTDLMAINLLRDSNLEPDSLLLAIKNLDRERNDSLNPFLDAAISKVSTHPEIELRVNSIRARLTHMRLNEGDTQLDKVSFNSSTMKKELASLSKHRFRAKPFVLKEGETYFSGNLRVLKEAIDWNKKYTVGKRWDSDIFLFFERLRAIPVSDISEVEVKEYINFVNSLYTDIKDLELWDTGLWYSVKDLAAPGRSNDLSLKRSREVQVQLRATEIFNSDLFQSAITPDVLDNIIKNDTFHHLALFYPVSIIESSIEHYIEKTYSLELTERVTRIMRLWLNILKQNYHLKAELRVLDEINKIYEIPESHPYIVNALSNFNNFFTNKKYYYERFVRYKPSHPELNDKLLQEYFNFFNKLTREEPSTFIRMFQPVDFLRSMVFWTLYPNKFLSPTKNLGSFNDQKLHDYYMSFLEQDNWKEEVRELWKAIIASGQNNNLPAPGVGFEFPENFPQSKMPHETPAYFFSNIYKSFFNRFTFKNEKVIEFFKRMIEINFGEVSLKNWNEISKFNQILSFDPERALLPIFIELAKNGERDLAREIIFNEKFQSSNPFVFGFNQLNDYYAESLNRFREEGILSAQEVNELFIKEAQKKHRVINEYFSGFSKTRLSNSTSINFWKSFFSIDDNSHRYLDLVLENHLVPDSSYVILKEGHIDQATGELFLIMNSLGVKHHPSYGEKLKSNRRALSRDLKELVLSVRAEPNSSEYKISFESKFDEVLEYIKKIFNPDGVMIPVHLESFFDYSSLDLIAYEFLKYIPDNLTYEQNKKLFMTFAAKRSNKYTDDFFRERLREEVLKRNDIDLINQILEYSLVKSEKTRIEFLRISFQNEINAILNSGIHTDQDIFKLTSKFRKLIRNSSKFYDDYLEDVAWKLQLTKKQLSLFVEPLKSFNYKRYSTGTVDNLSALNKLLAEFSTKEQLALIKYIQKPDGSIFEAVPRLEEVIEKIVSPNRGPIRNSLPFLDDLGKEMRSQIEAFEIILRDANDQERLLYIENIVGSRDYGLWFKGSSAREELYKLANIQSDKKILFESYLKALPEYEHSIIMSYLLASIGSEGESEIMKILEVFQTPGLKFAQIASIFSIFGEEESKNLAQAKNRAKPASRFHIFELLEQRLSPDQFKEIESIDRRLGSGSIKYVFQVTFKDGTKQAGYLRRAHIEETNKSTLRVAREWMKHLREHPEYTDKYDYDYYLDSLEEQLEKEIDFLVEAEKAGDMATLYESNASYKGWKFKGIRPNEKRPMAKDVIFYDLVSNVVSFDDLPEQEKTWVSEYIIKTEIPQLLRSGDADRHMGNYLFDLEHKVIYPLDPGQFYQLEQKGLFSLDESYFVTEMLYAYSLKDKKTAASKLYDVFDRMKTNENPLSLETEKLFKKNVEGILSLDINMDQKILKVMAELNKQRIRIPFRISLGVIKGFSIVLKEDYAKVAGQEFVNTTLEKEIKKIMIQSIPAKLVDKFKKTCNHLF